MIVPFTGLKIQIAASEEEIAGGLFRVPLLTENGPDVTAK